MSALAVLVGLGGHEALAQGAREEPWTEFTSKEGRFRVLLPVKATFEKQSKSSMWKAEVDRETGFLIHITDFTDTELGDAKATLKNTGDAIARGWTVITDREIQLGRCPGRELSIENAKSSSTTRLYVVDKRMYVITHISRKADRDKFAAVRERFFASFEVVTPLPVAAFDREEIVKAARRGAQSFAADALADKELLAAAWNKEPIAKALERSEAELGQLAEV
ncbi:MAG: hypothetical protein ACAI25_07130, partial [Planctomycetota bacterium]